MENKSYFSMVMRQFGLTKNQLDLAIEKGIIRSEESQSKKMRGGLPSKLLDVEEVSRHVTMIREFPRLSSREREAKKEYRRRQIARDRLEFHCLKCNRNIRTLRSSGAFESYYNRNLSREKALELLIRVHERLVHSFGNPASMKSLMVRQHNWEEMPVVMRRKQEI